jgi:hypothetical protein
MDKAMDKFSMYLSVGQKIDYDQNQPPQKSYVGFY